MFVTFSFNSITNIIKLSATSFIIFIFYNIYIVLIEIHNIFVNKFISFILNMKDSILDGFVR